MLDKVFFASVVTVCFKKCYIDKALFTYLLYAEL